MKNLILTLAFVSSLMLAAITYNMQQRGVQLFANAESGIGGAQSEAQVPQAARDNAADQSAFNRFLVTPNSAQSERMLRSLLKEVHHEFQGKFTATIPKTLLSQVKTLATVEIVPVHQLLGHTVNLNAKPVCGNGIIEGGEKCGEPGLSCPVGKECNNCKCADITEDPPPADRVCTPDNQINYNVSQVNGGRPFTGGLITGVVVAVLDSGIDTDHPDLVNRISFCKDATKRGIRNGCQDKDGAGHGTHTAGIIGADAGSDGFGMKGVNTAASLMVIKVCGGGGCFTDDIAAAIDYAGSRGAHIVNMSFGGASESSLIREAIARNPHMLFVASAGNSGPNANTIKYPAANPNVIAVAANDSGKIVASFSSRGIDDGNDSTIVTREVEFSAGGVAVESTHKNGCYSSLSGTSFSSPTIAGLASLVWQVNATDPAAATRANLVSLATDITLANGGGAGVGFDTASGYGLPVAP